MSAHDSTLQWPPEPPDLPPGGTSYTILRARSTEGMRVTRQWLASVRPGTEPETLDLPDHEDAVRRLVQDVCDRKMVGWRLAVVGDELAVITAHAQAVANGMTPDEVIAHAVSRIRLRMYCPHCRTVTTTTHQPEEVERCAGCSRTLKIRRHLSQVHAAYLASDTSSRGKERALTPIRFSLAATDMEELA